MRMGDDTKIELTEERVREIVREEVLKALKERANLTLEMLRKAGR